MSEATCDVVAERIALGEPLAELEAHAASCARCRLAVTLPARLGGTHAAVDTGLGFVARMTAGAQHRIVVRRRRRLVTTVAGGLAAAVIALVAVTRVSAPSEIAVAPPFETPAPIDQAGMQDIWHSHEPVPRPRVDPDVRALVHLANIDRDLRAGARWGRIGKPLRAYRSLVQGVK